MLFRQAAVAYALTPWYLHPVMTRPRTCLVSAADTRWYHCVSRCVRRAFLCGRDHTSGRDFEHRRAWVTDRLMELSRVFAIDVAAFAVMSNHHHLVLHLAPERAAGWTDDEVLHRWTSLFAGPPLVQRYFSADAALGKAELDRVRDYAVVFRRRLQDLSWFLRLLNETISRKANAEDGCTGRFWEGRFKSQALLDLPALLSAMIYVDLNPVRAGMAATLEASAHTSIALRLQELRSGRATALLMPFDATARASWAIPFALRDYIELADWTGRQHRPGKRGAIEASVPPILGGLGLEEEIFLAMSGQLLKVFGSAVGLPAMMVDHCERREMKYLRGIAALQKRSTDQVTRDE